MPGEAAGPLLRRLLLQIDVQSSAAAKLGAARRELDAVSGAAGRAGQASGQMGGSFAMASFAMAAGLGSALRLTAQFRTQATLAAFAAQGASGNINQMAQSAKNLSASLGQAPIAMAGLMRQISQMGLATPQLAFDLARVSAALSSLSGNELSANDTAVALYRLAQTTSRNADEFNRALGASDRYGSALLRVSNISAGGLQSTTTMLRQLSALGTTTAFTADQLIVLAGAFTNIDERSTASFATSLQRMFSKEFDASRGLGQVASMMHVTVEQAKQMKKDNPFDFYLRFLEAIKKKTASGGQDIAGLLNELGFGNIRDIRQVAALVSSLEDKIPQMQKAVSEEMTGDKLEIWSQYNRLMVQLGPAWDEFTSAMQRAALVIGEGLTPILVPLLKVLTGIANIFSEHPFLTKVIAGGIGATFVSKGLQATGGSLGRLLMHTGGFMGRMLGGPIGYASTMAGWQTHHGLMRGGGGSAMGGMGGMGMPFMPMGFGRRAGMAPWELAQMEKELVAGKAGRSMSGLVHGGLEGEKRLRVLSAGSQHEAYREMKLLEGHGLRSAANKQAFAAAELRLAEHMTQLNQAARLSTFDRVMLGASNLFFLPGKRMLKGAGMLGKSLNPKTWMQGIAAFGKRRALTAAGLEGMAAGSTAFSQGMTRGIGRVAKFSPKLATRMASGVAGGEVGMTRLAKLAGGFGGEGIAARLGGGLMGRAAGFGVRALTGPAGWVAMGLQVLTPLNRSLGNFFQGLSQGQGVVAGLSKPLAFVFKLLEAGGNAVGKVFDFVGEKVGGFLHWLGDATGVNKIFAAIGDGIDAMSGELDKFNGKAKSSGSPSRTTIIINSNGAGAVMQDIKGIVYSTTFKAGQYTRSGTPLPQAR